MDDMYLNCPRCGLALKPGPFAPPIEHCPRCIARSRKAVKLFTSGAPARVPYGAGGAAGGRAGGPVDEAGEGLL